MCGNVSAFLDGLARTVWHHRNSVKENLTMRIDFVDIFDLFVFFHTAFRQSSQFHKYSLHFSFQQSTVR